ncbi:flavin reductase family protein [Halorubrum luteum]
MPAYNVDTLSERERARIVKSAVSPRPIAWVSTRGEDGSENLAPYSSYNYVSSANPVVLFSSPNADHGGLKDSARNALETGEFAVNVVTEPLIDRMDATSEPLPTGESEFEAADVATADCDRIDAPRVADAPITMECTLYDSLEIHDRISVFGEVVRFHVDESVTADGKVDSRLLGTVGRLGGPYYTGTDPLSFERQH